MILSTPLKWPDYVEPPKVKRNGAFGKKNDKGWIVDITVAGAIERLDEELRKLKASNAELSANFGLTRAQNVQRLVASEFEQGVCLRFTLDGQEFIMPCWTYFTAADNIAALAAHIDATRAIARHGVQSSAQALQSFAALPPSSGLAPSEYIRPKRDWWTVLGIFPEAGLDVIEAVYRALAKTRHPDGGGSTEEFQELQDAVEEAREARK